MPLELLGRRVGAALEEGRVGSQPCDVELGGGVEAGREGGEGAACGRRIETELSSGEERCSIDEASCSAATPIGASNDSSTTEAAARGGRPSEKLLSSSYKKLL